MEFHSQLYDRNQQYLFLMHLKCLTLLLILDKAKILLLYLTLLRPKGISYRRRVFIPEFKISQCNIDRISEYLQYDRGFKISMNKVKQEFKSAESGVKELAKNLMRNLTVSLEIIVQKSKE